jgi:hypothetical protein
VRSRWLAAAGVALFLGAMAWSMVASAAVAAPTPTPTPGPTGSTTIGFTIPATSTPPPGGGSGGGGSGGGSGGGGTTPPACIPNKSAIKLTPAPAPSPHPLQLSTHRVAQGGDILVRGDGFKANEKIVIGLYSSPVKLGTATVRTNGQIYTEVTIPKKTQLGDHTIQVQGYLDCRIAAASINVVSQRGSGLSIFPWIVWLIVGGTVGLSAIGLLIYLSLGGVARAAAIGLSAGAAP